jgi:hypothetical protein
LVWMRWPTATSCVSEWLWREYRVNRMSYRRDTPGVFHASSVTRRLNQRQPRWGPDRLNELVTSGVPVRPNRDLDWPIPPGDAEHPRLVPPRLQGQTNGGPEEAIDSHRTDGLPPNPRYRHRGDSTYHSIPSGVNRTPPGSNPHPAKGSLAGGGHQMPPDTRASNAPNAPQAERVLRAG